MLVALKEQEEKRYSIEKDSLEKSLSETAVNAADKMKDAYYKYVTARDEATKEMLINEMVANGKSADEVIRVLKELDALKAQYYKKERDLDKLSVDEKLKNIKQIKDTMKDSLSEGFQDILTKSKKFFICSKKYLVNYNKSYI